MIDELNAEAGGEEEYQRVVPEVEQEARGEGWKPLDEFHGPEEQWVDAETFVKRGREINPILRKNNERLQSEIKALKDKLDTTNMSLAKVQEYHSQLEQRAYDRAVKDLREQRKSAMKDGDFETAAEIDEEIDGLREKKPAPPPVVAEKAAPKLDPILAEWVEDNKSWFNDQNPEMMDYANAVGMRLRRQDPENRNVGAPFLREVLAAVRKQFPEKFSSRRSAPALAEGSGSPAGVGGRKSAIADLPPEARAAYKDLAKEKWYIDLAKSQKLTTEQMYIQDYGV